MNSATCVAKYEDDGYHCTCTHGFLGKHCEEKRYFNFALIFLLSLVSGFFLLLSKSLESACNTEESE